MRRLLFGLAVAAAILAAERGQAGPVAQTEGLVAELQLIDASELGADATLILSLEDGRVFTVPGQRNVAASGGMKVRIGYMAGEQAGEIPELCWVEVVAMPITIDGEQRLQPAQRAFTVYRNSAPTCAD